MKHILTVIPTFFLYLLSSGGVFSAEYVGSEKCFKCHASEYNAFVVSGHPYKLSKAEHARHRGIPLPTGYTWDDISYVIGGVYKKARFIDKRGYIITSAKDGSDLKTQYNIETGTWSYYHKGEKKPYTCGKCHTTGFKTEGHQGGLEGIKGSWALDGIQCESCHGPASKHIKNGERKHILVDRSSEACGRCHIRGQKEKIPAKNGFIRHHEQLNELFASKHRDLTCVTCHDPHKKVQFSIKQNCQGCHAKQTAAYKDSLMQQVGVSCLDCHMPRATKSAVKRAQWDGDIRTHLFTIDVNKDAQMFYREKSKGKTKAFSRDFVSLDFACLNCHKDKDRAWAASKAKNIHAYGK